VKATGRPISAQIWDKSQTTKRLLIASPTEGKGKGGTEESMSELSLKSAEVLGACGLHL
jgi:hypothetical protein